MSELTMCCYCSLQLIRKQAKQEGRTVTLRPGGIGTEVFVHKKGEELVPWGDAVNVFTEKSNQVAEMVEISDSCCC